MKRVNFGLLWAAILVATTITSAQTPQATGKDTVQPQPITLTGCVAAGRAANTFVMTHVIAATDSAPEVGVYWLNEPEKLKAHVGHQVEVTGQLAKDTDKTDFKSKDGNVEMKSERGTKKVEVPEGTDAGDAITAVGTSGKQINYNVKVDSVKMISARCS